jgi:hypothetical protein
VDGSPRLLLKHQLCKHVRIDIAAAHDHADALAFGRKRAVENGGSAPRQPVSSTTDAPVSCITNFLCRWFLPRRHYLDHTPLAQAAFRDRVKASVG